MRTTSRRSNVLVYYQGIELKRRGKHRKNSVIISANIKWYRKQRWPSTILLPAFFTFPCRSSPLLLHFPKLKWLRIGVMYTVLYKGKGRRTLVDRWIPFQKRKRGRRTALIKVDGLLPSKNGPKGLTQTIVAVSVTHFCGCMVLTSGYICPVVILCFRCWHWLV